MSHADPTERRDPIETDERRDDAMRRDDAVRRDDDRDRLGERDRLDERDRDRLEDRDRPEDRDGDGADRRGDTLSRDDRDAATDRGHADSTTSSPVGIDERWEATQAQFLESPRDAVTAADELVTEVIEDVRRRLDAERAAVADTWKRDGSDTEDLRTAMLRYREVLDRLASRP